MALHSAQHTDRKIKGDDLLPDKNLQESRFHEIFDRSEPSAASSDRSFCLVMGAVFSAIGSYHAFRAHGAIMPYLLVASLFLATALIKPSLAHPLNLLWGRIGGVMAYVNNSILLTLIFYMSVVPIGLLMRLCGKDPLRLRFAPSAESYWIIRTPSGKDSMKNQF